MSGHSHWETNKRKKAAGDAKRGQLFTKIAKEITMAAREGGGDPESNFKLRLAMDNGRASNMPKDSIDRAIKRGTGESKDGMVFEDIIYEGYGPKGVAFMIECVTENKNRTVAEIRHSLTRAGGNLGESGSVAWQFARKGYFLLTGENLDFDAIFEMAVNAGAEDVVQNDDGSIEITTEPENFKAMSDALYKANVQIEEAELKMVPTQETTLSDDDTMQVLRIIDEIEELDDVKQIYHNMTVSDAVMEKLDAAEE